jgi:hypothetical protein
VQKQVKVKLDADERELALNGADFFMIYQRKSVKSAFISV